MEPRNRSLSPSSPPSCPWRALSSRYYLHLPSSVHWSNFSRGIMLRWNKSSTGEGDMEKSMPIDEIYASRRKITDRGEVLRRLEKLWRDLFPLYIMIWLPESAKILLASHLLSKNRNLNHIRLSIIFVA